MGAQRKGWGRTRVCVSLSLTSQQTVIADHSLSASHMETTMKLLKTRVQSRLALHKQFASLGKLMMGWWFKSHSGNTQTTT